MHMETRKMPIGIQTFENLRNENYIYVDKTELIYELANTESLTFSPALADLGKVCLFPH